MAEVGQQIRRLRDAKGWNQAELAVYAGIGPSGVSQIETGKRNPSAATLQKIAEALGVEISDLFPNVEAPLWSDKVSRAGAFNFREAREELEKYCQRWERRLAEGDLNDQAIDEFLATGVGWIPVLDIALQAEEAMLRAAAEHRQEGDNGNLLKQSEIWQADKRYLNLFSEIAKVLTRKRPELPADLATVETNVVSLQEARERTAGIRKRMVG